MEYLEIDNRTINMQQQDDALAEQQSLTKDIYIAGIGMLTPVGFDTPSSCAAIKAGISAYTISDYRTQAGKQVTLSGIPDGVFSEMDIEIDEGEFYSGHLDHIIRMSIFAIKEALLNHNINKPIPFIFSLQEPHKNVTPVNTETLMANFVEQCKFPLDHNKTHFLSAGRASGILGLELAMRYLNEQNEDYVLLGGADSYWSSSHIGLLDKDERLNVAGSTDGFVPGEAACYILLTRHPTKALNNAGNIVSLSAPGTGHESGHLGSEQPYLGEGLDQAVKQALKDYTQGNITKIYNSMNGESHWAKEFGVISIRNKAHFSDSMQVIHPAQNYGDLGAGTGTMLIGVAAHELLKQTQQNTHLVYASSDSAWRAAVRVSNIHLNSQK